MNEDRLARRLRRREGLRVEGLGRPARQQRGRAQKSGAEGEGQSAAAQHGGILQHTRREIRKSEAISLRRR